MAKRPEPDDARRSHPPALQRAVSRGFQAGTWAAGRLRAFRARRSGNVSAPAGFRVIAHRGASAGAPENTLPAFRLARELGARDVELDVQLARDDVLMVFHDADLAAKTGASGSVRDHDSATLRALDVGGWFDARHPRPPRSFAGTGICSLAEVFEELGDSLHYHVEIKSSEEAVPERLLDEIRARGLGDRVTITSFRTAALVRVRELDSRVPICQLVRRAEQLRESAAAAGIFRDLRALPLQRRTLERAAQRGFDQVALPAHQLSPRLVERAAKLELSVRAWRVRDLDDLDLAIFSGADGVTVDWPDLALAHLATRQSRPSA